MVRTVMGAMKIHCAHESTVVSKLYIVAMLYSPSANFIRLVVL